MVVHARKLPTRHERRRLETRQSLMDAAEHIVLTRGINALTADTLAAEANISRRSIFNHFNSVHDAVYVRLNEYLIDLHGEYAPKPSQDTSGFESDLIQEARRVLTPSNIEKYLHPVVNLGIRLTEGGIDTDIWASEFTVKLSRQSFERTRKAFPNAHPIHLKVLVNLLVNVIEGGVEFWLDDYFRAQENKKNSPNMADLHTYIHEGFDYVQHFIDGAATLEDPTPKTKELKHG